MSDVSELFWEGRQFICAKDPGNTPLQHSNARPCKSFSRRGRACTRAVEHMSSTLCVHRKNEMEPPRTLAAGNDTSKSGRDCKGHGFSDASTSSLSEVSAFPPRCYGYGFLQVLSFFLLCVHVEFFLKLIKKLCLFFIRCNCVGSFFFVHIYCHN